MSARVGDWIQTYSGRAFWPLDPRAEDVDIVDIAHALAQQCRYAGHCLRFYSVAEHCVLLSRAVPADIAMAALLHDSAEAYLVDVPRPVKRALRDYADIEAVLMDVIGRKFGVVSDLKRVGDYDHRILTDEMRQNMAAPPMPWASEAEPLGVTLRFWGPREAKAQFLTRYDEIRLTQARAS